MNNGKKNSGLISLSHGDGGMKTSELISNTILKYLGNEILDSLEDSAKIINPSSKHIAFTTDSFVVDPIFFPGGDIGKLCICGTINDLATTGCNPIAISLSLMIEEGLGISELERVLASARSTLDETGVKVVTGDTKVVERGSVDKLFINTAGLGFIDENIDLSFKNIKEGDDIIINGSIAEHGLAILSNRQGFDFTTSLVSDCAPLNLLVKDMIDASNRIHALRDATRGGIATILFEMSKASGLSFDVFEEDIPLKNETKAICEFLGLDPLYIANEGKLIAFVDSSDSGKVLKAMRKNKYGKDSAIIGKVLKNDESLVFLNTSLGTKRIIDLHYSEQLPRIC